MGHRGLIRCPDASSARKRWHLEPPGGRLRPMSARLWVRRLFVLSDLRNQLSKLLSRSIHIVLGRILTAAVRHLRT
jgi:hypothetical protein